MAYYRKHALIEKGYLANDYYGYQPVVLTQVLKGRGSLTFSQLQKAVAEVAEKNPGFRLRRLGHLAFSHWDDGGLMPSVEQLDIPTLWGEDGSYPEFLTQNFDPDEGPYIRVYFIDGVEKTLVFVWHHAVVDGRGAVHFTNEVFRALRGEPLKGTNSTWTDIDIVNSLNHQGLPKRFKPISPRPVPTVEDCGNPVENLTPRFHRLVIPGRHKRYFSKIIWSLSQAIPREEGQPLQLDVSTDLRKYVKGCDTVANASSMFGVSVDLRSSADDIRRDIALSVLSKNDAKLLPKLLLWLLRWFPARTISNPVGGANSLHHRGMYAKSGAITNLGFFRAKKWTSDNFVPTDCYTVPPCFRRVPFFINVAATEEGIALQAVMPAMLAADGQLQDLLSRTRDIFNENFVTDDIDENERQLISTSEVS